MHKNLFTFMLAVVCSTATFAQNKSDSSAVAKPKGVNLGMAFEPIFGFNNCFKVDFEAKPLNKVFGFEVNPELYVGKHLLKNINDDVNGWGLGLYQKFYVYQNGYDAHPVMLAYGATYRSVDVTYSGEGFIPYTQSGLNYYRYGNFTDVLHSQSVLINMYVSGRLVDIPDAFFLDTYFGFGYKFAKQQSGFDGYRDYNTHIYDYGYKGAAFLAGVKLGIQYKLKK